METEEFFSELRRLLDGKEGFLSIEANKSNNGINTEFTVVLNIESNGRKNETRTRRTGSNLLPLVQQAIEDLRRL